MHRPSFITALSHRRATILTIVVLVAVGALLVGSRVFAESTPASNGFQVVGNTLGNAFYLLLNFLLLAMIKLVGSLTGMLISLLVVVARYNTFLNAPIVRTGWPIVRDLMNMVFIIALLVIAAGTVLRLQNYRYNRLLGKLIIMALLVNFSKFIAVFLLQFAQVVMLTFVNAFRDVAIANFSHMFGLDAVATFAAGQNPTSDNGNFSIFITLLAGLFMMVIAFTLMLAMTVMLFVRIVALWLLVILSPLAYALRVLPQTEQYAGQWWREFTKYAVLGPVLAFFLWLALALVGGGSCQGLTGCNPLSSDAGVKAGLIASDTATASLRSDFVTEILSTDRLVSFIVAIIFLTLGLQYAQKSGAAGAGFAGKISDGGFGAARTLTGMNYVGDRTVKPIQGWIRNRQKARDSAIQERTETLEAAGDRVRGALPGRGGEKARAAAAAYDRNRTARTAQKYGYKDQTEEELHEKMLNSNNHHERMAAMMELQGRKKLNLSDPAVRAAFDDITNRTRRLTGQQYMPEADRRKNRQDILRDNFEHMDADQIRDMQPMLTDPEEDEMMVQALEKKKALDAHNDDDAHLVDDLRDSLVDLPARLKAFDDALMKSNPEMALRTIFRGLGEHAETLGSPAAALQETEDDAQRFTTAVQQGIMTPKVLTPELQARFAQRLQSNGTTQEYAQNYIARQMVHGARTREDMDRNLSAMDDESLSALLDGSQLEYRDAEGAVHHLDQEKQKSLAGKHFYGEAFTRMDDATGALRTDTNAAQQYGQLNGAKVKEGYRTKKVSNGTLQNGALMQILDHLPEVDDDDVKDLTKDERKREFYGRTKMQYVDGLKAAGARFNPTLAGAAGVQARENLSDVKKLVIAARGGKLKDVTGAKRQSLVAGYMGGTNAQQSAELENGMQQFIRTNGDDLTRMDYDELKSNFGYLAGRVRDTINTRAMTAIHDKNTQSVISLVRDKRALFNQLGAMNPTAAQRADPRYAGLLGMFNPRNGRVNTSDILSAY